MHPYRDRPVRADPDRPELRLEERIVYGVLLAIGAIPIAIRLGEHARLGTQATLGWLMVCAGALGLVLTGLHARHPGGGSRSR